MLTKAPLSGASIRRSTLLDGNAHRDPITKLKSAFRSIPISVVAGCSSLVLGSAAHAALTDSFTYAPPAIVGPDVTYTNVSETDTPAVTPPDDAYFGAPTLAGDGLAFNPSFRVEASNGGADSEDGTLYVTLSANNLTNNSINLLSISESGDYDLFHATSASAVAAILNIQGLLITQVNGNTPVNIPVPYTESFANVSGSGPSVITSDSIVYSGAGPLVSGQWSASASFNIAAALAGADRTGQNVTGLSLVLDNTLQGVSETSSVVEIDKKSFDLIVGTSNPMPSLPDPMSLPLIGAAGLLAVRRRNKA